MRLLPVGPDHGGGSAARKNTKPTREQIVAAMNGNICRCGTYTPHHPRDPARRGRRR